MIRVKHAFVLVALAAGLAGSVFAQGKTQTRLLLSADKAQPGKTIWAGFEMKMPAGWHSYWRNCGDAGLPTSVAWTLPAGVSAGDLAWPLPEKSLLTVGETSLCTYLYEGRVVLLTPIKLDAAVKTGTVELRAALTWLECSDKAGCVPGQAMLTVKLTVGDQEKLSADAPLLAQWRDRVPRSGPAPTATARWEKAGPDETRTIIIDWSTTNRVADFYPYEKQPSDIEGPTQLLSAPPGHVLMRKTVKKYEGQWPDQLTGLLVNPSASPHATAVEVILPLAALRP